MKKKSICFLTGVIILMSLFGCGKPKYVLTFEKTGFETEKKKYEEGEKVTVYYDMIATDTDYSFYTDSEDVVLKQEYDNNHGYVFTFQMPAHDVKMGVSSRNSMVYEPVNPGEITEGDEGEIPNGAWKCLECNYDKNTGGFCSNCGSKKP